MSVAEQAAAEAAKAPESSEPLQNFVPFRKAVLERPDLSVLEPFRTYVEHTGWLILALLIALGAGAIVIGAAPYPRKTEAKGVLEPMAPQDIVSSPGPGTIVAVHVRSGDEIAAGAPLITLRTSLGDNPGQVVVKASKPGWITSVEAQAGAQTAAGAPLASVLSKDTALFAEIHLPSRAIGFVRPGDEVHLSYDAFPAHQFGSARGWVQSVSAVPVSAPAGVEPRSFYPVRVALERQTVRAFGKDWPLRSGMKTSAIFILEKRSFFGWMLEPAFGARKRDR